MKKEILQKLAELADKLDANGFYSEAAAVDAVMQDVVEEKELSNEEIVERLEKGPWVGLPKEIIAGYITVHTTDMDWGKMPKDKREELKKEAEYIKRNSKIRHISHMGPSEYFVILNSGVDPDPDALFLAAYGQFGFGGDITRIYPDKEGHMRYVVTTNTLD